MKILFISDSIKMNSGYSIVTRNLAIGLKKLGYDVSTVGLQTAYCNEYFDSSNDNGSSNSGERIDVLPILTDKSDDIGQMMSHIQNFGPDTVIYVGNLGDNDEEVPSLAKVFPGTICYVPINGRDVPLGIVNGLNGVVNKGGKVIAMCKYGYDEMIRGGVNVDSYIYHGYDDKIFKKIDMKDISSFGNEIVSILKWSGTEEKADEGRRWIQHNVKISDVGDLLKRGNRFIYLSVGQNIGVRKRQERLLTAYAIMIKESKQLRDRTILHLHCLPISPRGLNLIEVVMKFGIQENVSFSYGNYLSAGWNSESLNVLYNMADVHISASSSEGFGIPSLESMACGKANIAPNCTSFTELIGNEYGSNLDDASKNRGLLANIESWHMEPSGRFKPLVNQEHLGILLKTLYVDEELREKLGNNAEKWVKTYRWSEICKQWDKLLKNI